MLLVAIAEPLMTIPQIIDIYSHHSTEISILTWVLYAIASAMWLIYGLYRRSVPLIVTGALWIVMDFLVVFGIVIYS